VADHRIPTRVRTTSLRSSMYREGKYNIVAPDSRFSPNPSGAQARRMTTENKSKQGQTGETCIVSNRPDGTTLRVCVQCPCSTSQPKKRGINGRDRVCTPPGLCPQKGQDKDDDDGRAMEHATLPSRYDPSMH
jgi:hypothetical protein